MYISRFVEFPTQETTEWWARSYGEDALTLTPADYEGHDTIYIGVYGFVTTTYTIVAQLDTVIDLLNGVPQSASAAREETTYFTFTVADPSAADHIAISAVATEGHWPYLLLPSCFTCMSVWVCGCMVVLQIHFG